MIGTGDPTGVNIYITDFSAYHSDDQSNNGSKVIFHLGYPSLTIYLQPAKEK